MDENLTFFTKSDKTPVSFKEGVVILVDKPSGWTSFDVVGFIRNRLSRIEGVKRIKVGHAGTLDPLATGLLIVCAGKYTKKIESFVGMMKRYSGTIILGATRPSYDMETEIDKTFPIDHITDELMDSAVKGFQGEIIQKPPIFSAIKKDGERLYKKARRGETVEIKGRKIFIENFEIERLAQNEVKFTLDCSKGTYVRSLAYDFGEKMESGGYLGSLQRDKIGEFSLENAWSIEELKEELNKLMEKAKNNVG